MCERSLSGSKAASAGTDSAVPITLSLRQTKSLASRGASLFNTAASRVSRSFAPPRRRAWPRPRLSIGLTDRVRAPVVGLRAPSRPGPNAALSTAGLSAASAAAYPPSGQPHAANANRVPSRCRICILFCSGSKRRVASKSFRTSVSVTVATARGGPDRGTGWPLRRRGIPP